MLDEIRVFVTLSRERHYGRAARALGLAQPTVSRRITRLEERVGFRLVERTTRNVALTDAGTALAGAWTEIIGLHDSALSDARGIVGGRSGTIRVGYTAASLALYGAYCLQELKRERPDIIVDLVELGTNQQVDALMGRTIDIALMHPPVSVEDLRIVMVSRQPLVLAVPAGHPFANSPVLPLAAFSQEPMLLYPRAVGPFLYDAILAACGRAGFAPYVIQECTSWGAAVDLAAQGMGTAWVPAVFAERARQSISFVRIEDEHTPHLPYAVATARPERARVRSVAEDIIRCALLRLQASSSRE